jgi:hypothetical protein
MRLAMNAENEFRKDEKRGPIFNAIQQLISQCSASGFINITQMMAIENFLYKQVICNFLLSLKSNQLENERIGIKHSNIEDIEKKFMDYENGFLNKSEYEQFKQYVKNINVKIIPVLDGFEEFAELNECERVLKEIRNPAYPKKHINTD